MQNACKLSIITINYNGLKDTCELIDSIPFNDELEVIVVDNDSKKDEASVISAKYPQVIVIRSPQNFQALIDRLESSPKIAVVCPKIRFSWGNHPIQFAGYTPLSKITVRNQAIGFGEEDRGQYDTAHPTPYAHGAAMLIKREAIDKVGLMPECYFLYYEELDWSMMFTRAGFEIWYDPACTVYHKESQATGQNSPLRTYYIVRNRLLLVKRNWNGVTKYLTYTYLLGAVGLRDIVKNALTGKWDMLKATTNGLRDFYNNHLQ